MRSLTITNLSKSYGKTSVLRNVSLTYSAGLIHGLVGDNGAGKTTLLSCIAGYERFDGSVERAGVKSIGYLHAEPYMFPRITGREFIRFCLHAKKVAASPAEISALNKLFELPLEKYAAHYSTGMLKKLHIMSLILQQNDLLLLDEPFNGLDISSSSCITEILKQLRQNGSVIIVSSHALHHLAGFCDTISFVHGGAVDFFPSRENFGALIKSIELQAQRKIEHYFHSGEPLSKK
ncbi:MAG: ABC transporter ATP-binding protein [Prevotellaceae bacterium]|jgi:ABC-2 type transport system ATP-binding protein|nr:ABC transporter ATP-binding protein [Prevotellaceae bacterium]